MARDKITNHKESVNIVTCPVMRALLVLGGKWKILLLYLLAYESKNGYLRYSDFTDLIPNISARVLTAELRELEADGFLSRHDYQEVPPRVEYNLTDLGKSFLPVFEHMKQWGEENL